MRQARPRHPREGSNSCGSEGRSLHVFSRLGWGRRLEEGEAGGGCGEMRSPYHREVKELLQKKTEYLFPSLPTQICSRRRAGMGPEV